MSVFIRSLARSQERGPSGLSATPRAQLAHPQEQVQKRPDLKPEISELEVLYEVSLKPAAAKFVESLMKNLTCFSIAFRDEWGEISVVMVELGFFRRTGDRYQMFISQAIFGLKSRSGSFPHPMSSRPVKSDRLLATV